MSLDEADGTGATGGTGSAHSGTETETESIRMQRTWDPEDQYKALLMDRDINEEYDEAQTARRIFKQNLPLAAQSICHLAVHSANEGNRFRAAQYVVERNLGRLQDGPPLQPDNEDPLMQLLREINQEASKGGTSSPPVEAVDRGRAAAPQNRKDG